MIGTPGRALGRRHDTFQSGSKGWQTRGRCILLLCCNNACGRNMLGALASFQEHADNLRGVLEMVVAHQGVPLASRLAARLLGALVEPRPEDHRPILRRLTALSGPDGRAHVLQAALTGAGRIFSCRSRPPRLRRGHLRLHPPGFALGCESKSLRQLLVSCQSVWPWSGTGLSGGPAHRAQAKATAAGTCQAPRDTCAGADTAEVAAYAGRLLERSLMGELRAVVARALSGLDMFSGDLSELIAGDLPPPGSPPKVPCAACSDAGLMLAWEFVPCRDGHALGFVVHW